MLRAFSGLTHLPPYTKFRFALNFSTCIGHSPITEMMPGLMITEASGADPIASSIFPTFSSPLEERKYLKHRLAQAFRIFGYLGYDEGIAGHITMRDPVDTNTFWVNPFGRHFSSIRAEDLLHVDHACNILSDSGKERILNKPAFMIHSTIHMKRPDVNCAAHSHAIHGRAFSTLGIELDMITQDACGFYNDHVVCPFGGIVLDKEEGIAISEALQHRKAAILQNHGLLVATDSIESTVHFFISLENCCKVQLLADAAAKGRGVKQIKIDNEEAYRTWKILGSVKGGFFAGLPQFQALERREAALPPELRFDAPKHLNKGL